MSGFEVAGIILGALPLIVSAIESYSKVAKKAGLWRHIRHEYQKFDTHMQCQRLDYITTVRVWLLPLVTAGDGDRINRLIADPQGAEWGDPEIDDVLRAKLQGQYELYKKIVGEIRQIVLDLERELSMDSAAVRETIEPSVSAEMQDASYSWRKMVSRRREERKDSRSVVKFKWRFMNGQQTRNNLLNDFATQNKNLKTVLNVSDKGAEVAKTQAAIASKSVTDDAICSFYLQAARLFKLLLASWKCTCPRHIAKLQLQHRTSLTEPEFRLLFATSRDSYWELQQIGISQGSKEITEKSSLGMTGGIGPKLQQEHRATTPVKPTMGVRRGMSRPKQVELLSPPVPGIEVTAAGSMEAIQTQAIHNLCTSLAQYDEPYYGYLHGEDCRYYLYPVSHGTVDTFASLSLAELLTRKPKFRRLQRLALSLALASSFLQLFESPWLPALLGKSAIQFIIDPNNPRAFRLDQPHIDSNFFQSSSQEQRHAKIKESLPRLGIILLELCFGEPLETQGFREELGTNCNAKANEALDFAAAMIWLEDVSEEAGPDYAEVISWCLTGIRLIPTGTQEWRKQMLLKVVRPLEKCYRDLKEGL